MDFLFSIIILGILIYIFSIFISNVNLYNKNLRRETLLVNNMIEEAEKEIKYISNQKKCSDFDYADKKINVYGDTITINRKCLDKEYGLISSEIFIEYENIHDSIKVYSILDLDLDTQK
ncbi:hypothetical protein [Peptostreptococcus faecalis]|uniref:hypothetical protein n=1 Tax=Peptostreptococcus faecalis TaxID=2045015 RepID=UPI000C7C8B3B|nr:hypothetical protein [Peptostreptococcus faecalis]